MDVNTKKTYLKTRPYPVIEPYIITKDLTVDYTTARSAKDLTVKAFFTRYQDAIKKGLRDGVPNASGNYSEGVVTDAMKYLNQRDATNNNIKSEYGAYFNSLDYKKKVLNDYIQFYYSGADKDTSSFFDTEKVWNEINNAIFGKDYKDKLTEVLLRITEYQGGVIDMAAASQFVNDGYMQNQSFGSGGGTGGENNQNGNGGGSSATSNTNYLLIGIVILVGIFLLKRSKK